MRVILFMLIGFLLVLPVFAQDAETTEEPPLTSGLWTYAAGGEVEADCFGSTATYDPYDDYDADALPNLALTPVGDGAWLLIQAGADYLFTPADDGSYSARLIDSEGILTFEGTMEITSPDSLQLVGAFVYDPSCTASGTTLFERVEAADVSLWTESDREFSDITFFNECLGKTGAEATGTAWAAPDFLAVLSETETGLTLDNRAFAGAAGEYIYEDRDESINVTAYDRITLNGVPDDERLMVNHFYQINDRSDCQVEYDSEYVPFDGDIDALLARIPVSE